MHPLLFLVALLAGVNESHAHVRWFTEEAAYPGVRFPMDFTNGLVMAGAMLFGLLALAIERAQWPGRAMERIARLYHLPEGTEWRIVAFLTGIMFLANSTMRVFLAPNLHVPDDALTGALLAQSLLGLLLLTQLTFSIAGVLIMVATLVTALLVPPALLMDYVCEFLGLGVALLLIGPVLSPVDQKLFRRLGLDAQQHRHRALPILRIGVGLTLLILAFHEKLLNPGISLAFLEMHRFNFMPLLGFANFTDLHFVFAAGVAEATFGVLLVCGLATRFVTGVLSIFFVLTLLALGPIELVGHAPLFGIAFLLMSRGAGRLMERTEAPATVVESATTTAFAMVKR
ncbi:MAG: hypothetical protein AB1705_13840 [Verrucomicrobiota bacterium]